MSSKIIAIIIGTVLAIALVLFMTTYTVNFHEVAIVTRFGRTGPGSVQTEPGLKFRLPLFIDKVAKIDTRLQLRESGLETVPTADGQQVVVRGYLMWKLDTDVSPDRNGPLTFHNAHPGGVDDANAAIVDQFRGALRSGLGRFTFNDLVGGQSKLAEAETAIMNELAALKGRGIQPVSVGISQLLLPSKTTVAVLDRMKVTRETLANRERNKGVAQAAAIQARAKHDAEKIRTFAAARAEEIRALGNVAAASMLTEMAQEEDLAIFLSWLDALRTALSERSTLVIPTVFEPFHMLQLDSLTDSRGIPQPAKGSTLAGPQPKEAPASSTSSSQPEVPAPVAAAPHNEQASANSREDQNDG